MQQILIGLFVMMACSKVALGCDVCGGINPAIGIGSSLENKKSVFGFTHGLRQYVSSSNHANSSEVFNRFDLFFQFKVKPRFTLRLNVPYQIAIQKRKYPDLRLNSLGIGDASLQLNYFVADKLDSITKRKTVWSLGIGLKVPSGQFVPPHDNFLILKPGTGSIDFPVKSTFLFQKGKNTFLNDSDVSYNLENKFKHKRGISINSSSYFIHKIKNVQLVFGTHFSKSFSDRINGQKNLGSVMESTVFSGSFGFIYRYQNFVIQANVQKPILQQIANGNTKQIIGSTLTFYYLI
jgi:hypothetical protein